MSKIIIDSAKCKGCLLCVDVCPKKVLETDEKQVNAKGYNPVICVDEEACTSCAICARICPDSVIEVRRYSK